MYLKSFGAVKAYLFFQVQIGVLKKILNLISNSRMRTVERKFASRLFWYFWLSLKVYSQNETYANLLGLSPRTL